MVAFNRVPRFHDARRRQVRTMPMSKALLHVRKGRAGHSPVLSHAASPSF